MNRVQPAPADRTTRRTTHRPIENPSAPLDGVCKYPNLLAEYKASGYHVSTLADHSRMTTEAMTAVLTDGADIAADSMFRLSQLFGVRFSYLASRQLMTFRPATPTGQNRMEELDDLFRSILPDRDLFVDPYHHALFHRAVTYMTDAENAPERPRTVAGWRWTKRNLLSVIDFQKKTRRRNERNRNKRNTKTLRLCHSMRLE